MFGLTPTVFCGPMKSGTTWVHEYLKARGDVCLPERTKEIFFFDRYYGRGLAWYAGQFRPRPHHRILVDVAPSIIAHPEAPARVARTLPGARVVLLRRDPVARSWSHYLHLKRYGYTSAPLAQAIAAHPAIIEASRSDLWLSRWREELGAERVRELDAEILFRDAVRFAEDLDRVLGLPRTAVDIGALGKVNGAAAPRHHLISSAARTISYTLRDLRLDGVVHAARRMGLNRIYASDRSSGPPPKATESDRALIAEKLSEPARAG